MVSRFFRTPPGRIAALFLVLILLLAARIWHVPLGDIAARVQFALRGQRDGDPRIVLVYLGQREIDALGGWPVSRDYYGYALHLLTEAGARAVYLDLLLTSPSPLYREYDARLADFIAAHGNVVLPMVYGRFEPDPDAGRFRAGDATLPLPAFANAAAATAFSNLGPAADALRLPMIAGEGDSLRFAVAAHLAARMGGPDLSGRQAADVHLDALARLRLNHIGGLNRFAQRSFLDLIRPESDAALPVDLRDALVIIAVTAPGSPVFRATPYSDHLPAALLHATAVENLLNDSGLRALPVAIEMLLVLLVLVAGWWCGGRPERLTAWGGAAVVTAGGLLASSLAFQIAHTVVPLVVPLGGLWLLFLLRRGLLHREARRDRDTRNRLLQVEIERRQAALAEARERLAELETRLSASDAGEQRARDQQAHIQQLENELLDLRAAMLPETPRTAPADFPSIVHEHGSPMEAILALLPRVAPEDIPVLITGETGTGKELVAQAIHRNSARREAPFVAVNCGALPETLLESELFGHEKGSFTGATSRRRGRFELADGGTLFLDEITETSPAFQARLLRAVQEQRFERLGGEATVTVNVRVIAATNRDIAAEIAQGRFREDLFYRLKGFQLDLPPLRDRLVDLPLLIAHILTKYDYQELQTLSERALRALRAYAWPGNIRELHNAVRHAAILARGEGRDYIKLEDLPPEIRESLAPPPPPPPHQPELAEQILARLRVHGFSRSAMTETARELGKKDRGTITEYFRGICFEALVANGFDRDAAVAAIAASDDPEVRKRVRRKLNRYIANLHPLPEPGDSGATAFRGLPKKYHDDLERVIAHLWEKG